MNVIGASIYAHWKNVCGVDKLKLDAGYSASIAIGKHDAPPESSISAEAADFRHDSLPLSG
ncbi:MAG: hypothetical protein WA634_07910 [Silvibacterium sp.]